VSSSGWIAAGRLEGGNLCRHESQKAHELASARKAREVPNFGNSIYLA
jgi:hypothetical protein